MGCGISLPVLLRNRADRKVAFGPSLVKAFGPSLVKAIPRVVLSRECRRDQSPFCYTTYELSFGLLAPTQCRPTRATSWRGEASVTSALFDVTPTRYTRRRLSGDAVRPESLHSALETAAEPTGKG